MKLLSIVVPTYNEEDNVVPLSQALIKIFQEYLPNYDYEIIFIDNDSQDKTRYLIAKFVNNYLVKYKINRAITCAVFSLVLLWVFNLLYANSINQNFINFRGKLWKLKTYLSQIILDIIKDWDKILSLIKICSAQ